MSRPSNPSDGASLLRAWLGFALLLVAHFAIGPLLSGPVTPDFLLIAVLFASVRVRPGVAAVIGFASGLLLDALAPMHFGAAAVVCTALAFAASWLKAAFFSENVFVTGLFVFAGKWLFDLALAGVSGRFQTPGLLAHLLIWSPLAALLAGVLAVVLLTMFRSLYRPATR